MIPRTPSQHEFRKKYRHLITSDDPKDFEDAFAEIFDIEQDISVMYGNLQKILDVKRDMNHNPGGKIWKITQVITELVQLRKSARELHYKLGWLKKCGKGNRRVLKKSLSRSESKEVSIDPTTPSAPD